MTDALLPSAMLGGELPLPLPLAHGASYTMYVCAADHVGLAVCSPPSPFTFDLTPPSCAPPTRERIVRVAVVVKLKEALEPLHELEVVLVFAADQELNGDFFGHAYFTKAVLDDLMEGRGKGEKKGKNKRQR